MIKGLPAQENRSTSRSAPEHGRIKAKSLTERILERVEARYNAEYQAYMERRAPKPAPLNSPHRFTEIVDEFFETEKRNFFEARLHGGLGNSLDNVTLRICLTGLASLLIQALPPKFHSYVEAKIFQADKESLPPVLKDEIDSQVEQALSDRKRLKDLFIKLHRGEVTANEHIREEDIERAKRYIRRRTHCQT